MKGFPTSSLRHQEKGTPEPSTRRKSGTSTSTGTEAGPSAAEKKPTVDPPEAKDSIPPTSTTPEETKEVTPKAGGAEPGVSTPSASVSVVSKAAETAPPVVDKVEVPPPVVMAVETPPQETPVATAAVTPAPAKAEAGEKAPPALSAEAAELKAPASPAPSSAPVRLIEAHVRPPGRPDETEACCLDCNGRQDHKAADPGPTLPSAPPSQPAEAAGPTSTLTPLEALSPRSHEGDVGPLTTSYDNLSDTMGTAGPLTGDTVESGSPYPHHGAEAFAPGKVLRRLPTSLGSQERL